MTPTPSKLLPDHVLAAVLALAKKKSRLPRFAFRGHDYQLQEIFAGLSDPEKHPILNAFVFSNTGPELYSPALNESVSRLQLSGLIGRENPDYAVVFLQPSAEKFFDEVLSKQLSNQDREQLEDIASQFLNRVKPEGYVAA